MQGDVPLHYVCTHDEARKLAGRFDRFWVSNCGCRESRPGCQRSRVDVCLMFAGDIDASGSDLKEVPPSFVDELLSEAGNKRLVTRPFRSESDPSKTEGICFCCDDCCGYFLSPDDVCDKGTMVESTDEEDCTHCGLCPDVCYFGARRMDGDRLVVNGGRCYGCGLCVDVCPEDCIRMVERA